MTGNGGRWGRSGIGGWRRLVGGVNAVLLFDGFLCVFACEVPTGGGRSYQSHIKILTKQVQHNIFAIMHR